MRTSGFAAPKSLAMMRLIEPPKPRTRSLLAGALTYALVKLTQYCHRRL